MVLTAKLAKLTAKAEQDIRIGDNGTLPEVLARLVQGVCEPYIAEVARLEDLALGRRELLDILQRELDQHRQATESATTRVAILQDRLGEAREAVDTAYLAAWDSLWAAQQYYLRMTNESARNARAVERAYQRGVEGDKPHTK